MRITPTTIHDFSSDLHGHGESVLVAKFETVPPIYIVKSMVPYESTYVDYYDSYEEALRSARDYTEDWHSVWEKGRKVEI